MAANQNVVSGELIAHGYYRMQNSLPVKERCQEPKNEPKEKSQRGNETEGEALNLSKEASGELQHLTP